MHTPSRRRRLILSLFVFLTAAPFVITTTETLAMGSRPTEERQKPDGTRWAEPLKFEWADNFHKLSPEIYRSGQPTAEAMQHYENIGIKTIINLRSRHSDEDLVKGTNLTLVEIPIMTTRVNDDKYVIEVLQTIRDAQKPVLIHCKHGADRTGMMIASYRVVEQGWSKEDALEELKEGGFGFHSIWGHIPEYIEKMDVEKIRAALH